MSAQAAHGERLTAYQRWMPIIQLIELEGEPVAVTVGADRAVISEHVTRSSRSTVEAMCVFALQIAAGERPGPYRATEAERWARRHRTRRCERRS